MNEPVQTWHYGLVARHWAENNTTGPEIAYFQQQIVPGLYRLNRWDRRGTSHLLNFPQKE